jgi:hypothetical protein
MSKILLNKNQYTQLIDQDIQRVLNEMKQSPERDHVLQILKWSINQLYKDENTQKSTD